MAAANAPSVVAFGEKMVAPVIMAFGSDEQKSNYLPDILSSKVWWCQGYSEPGSGSDLASLKTKAEDNDKDTNKDLDVKSETDLSESDIQASATQKEEDDDEKV